MCAWNMFNGLLYAGQAVVQMARGKNDRLDYAIKFFVSQDAFESELAMYGQGSGAPAGVLSQFLPRVIFLLLRICANTWLCLCLSCVLDSCMNLDQALAPV